MSIEYRIYSNDGAGGPVDYGTPVATVSALTWDTPALAPSSDTTFAVRAHDTVTGLEDRNLDATVRIVLDASGNDITARPNAPTDLQAEPGAGGTLRVLWQYVPGGQGGAPTGFRVYIGSPTPNYTTPAATYPYSRGRLAFAATLTGLADGSYQVAVRAYNATTEEANTAVVVATIDSAGPDPIDELTATAA